MGLYSLMIDNLFKKIESQKEEVPFFLFFFFKKIKTLLARHTITKKRKKRHPRGDFHFSGQESRGAIHVSNIFRAKNKQAASISRSQPRGSSVKFRAAKFRSFHWHLRRVHTRRVHTYISVEHREPTVVLFRSLRDSRHPLDANSLTEPREEEEEEGEDYASRETILCVTRISARYFFRSVESRDGLTLKGEVDWKVEEGDWRKNFGEKNFEFLDGEKGFLSSFSFYLFDRTKLSRIIIDLETRFFWKRTYSGSEIIECFFFKEKLANNNAGEKYVARIFTPPRPSFLQRHQGYGPPVFPCTGFASLKYCRCFGRRRRKKKGGKNYRGQLLSALEYKNRDCVKTVRA